MSDETNEIETLIEYEDNPKKLFLEIIQLKRQKRNKEGAFSHIIKDFLAKTSIDLCASAEDAIRQGVSVFSVSHALEDSLPYAKVNLEKLISLIKYFHESMKKDMARDTQFICIENMVERQPDTAKKLLELLMNITEEFTTNYISCIITKLSTFEFDIYHKYALEHAKSIDELNIKCGLISTLSRINYSLPKNEAHFKLTLQAFEELESCNDDHILYSIVAGYGNLLRIDNSISEKILKYSKASSPDIRYSISHTLFIQRDSFFDESWFKESVLNYAYESYKNKGILDHIDFILSDYIKSYNPELVIEFLLNWISKSDFDTSEEANLCKIFNSTFAELIIDKKAFEKLLTKTLIHEDKKIHQSLPQFAAYLGLNKTEIGLCGEIVEDLSNEELVYILRKSLAYFYTLEMLSTIAFSILSIKTEDSNAVELVTGFFINNISYEYYHSSIEVLDQKILSSNESMKNILTSIKEVIIDKHQNLIELPALKELRSSNHNYLQVEKARAITFSKAMDNANSESVFLSMVTTTPLKYGNKFTSYFKGNYQAPSKLSQISHSVEIPYSEIIHPVDSAFEKFILRQSKKGDK